VSIAGREWGAADHDLQQVLRAQDCRAALADVDGAWSRNSCDEDDGPIDNGCNASGGDAASIAILLALAAVLVRHR
jgi:uncharacterized protein (TIGR03382 family)